MPVLTSMVLPPPSSAGEFEDLTLELLQRRFAGACFRRIGRSGQRQHGIDGFDSNMASGGTVWQATLQTRQLEKKLRVDLSRAVSSVFRPSRYVFVTAAPRDATLSSLAIALSTSECRVEIAFWEDLWVELTNAPSLFRKYYPVSLNPRPWWVAVLVLVASLVVASVMGGAVWGIFWGKLGGSVEPHGVAALLWPLVTNVFVVAAAWFFAREAGTSKREALAYLAGLSVGSALFYDLPVGPFTGIRSNLESRGWSFFATESLLVVVWTFLLSTSANFAAWLSAPSARGWLRDLGRRLAAIASAVGITALPVIFFVRIFGQAEESARGIVAGTLLRTSLGLGLALPFLLQVYRRWNPLAGLPNYTEYVSPSRMDASPTPHQAVPSAVGGAPIGQVVRIEGDHNQASQSLRSDDASAGQQIGVIGSSNTIKQERK